MHVVSIDGCSQRPCLSVSDFGFVSSGCYVGPEPQKVVHPRSSQPHALWPPLMVFKRMRDWPFIAAPTWAFGVTAFYVIQDHPAYIPCGQRWPLRPELAAPLGVWPSSQLAQCAAGRGRWRLEGDVALLSCCTVCRISSSGPGRSDRFSWTTLPVLLGRRSTVVNCNLGRDLAPVPIKRP
jgi:hypothetical protein